MPTFLPIELVDHIIHLAVGTSQSHPKGASSIALISHYYRTIANKETFSSVMFLGKPPREKEGEVPRIHGLAKLIVDSRNFPALCGVHTFITSFSLKLSTYRGSRRSPSEASQSLITIINNLFRDAALLSAPHRTLTLTACTWPDDEALDGALRSLITASYINTLYMNNPFSLPVDIILGSNIEHFTMDGSIFMARNFYTVKGYKSVPLKSLSITGGGYTRNLTFNDMITVICGQDSPTHDMFSHLTTLSITVTSPDLAANLVNSTKTLESLTLQKANGLFSSETDGKPRIRFQYLQCLKELNIAYSRSIDNEKQQISPVAFLGQGAPPLLEKINLDIKMYSDLRAPFPTPEDHLKAAVQERQEASQWDNHLSSSRMFCSLKTIRVKLGIVRLLYFYGEDLQLPSWDVAWCPYFMAAFPMCKRAYKDVFVTYSSAWSVAG